MGGVGALASSVVGAVKTIKEAKKSIDTYSKLKTKYAGTGKDVHHIVEKRLLREGSRLKAKDMLSCAINPAEHKVYTSEWRKAIPYRKDKTKPYKVSRLKLYKTSRKIYKNSRVLRMVAYRTIWSMFRR